MMMYLGMRATKKKLKEESYG